MFNPLANNRVNLTGHPVTQVKRSVSPLESPLTPEVDMTLKETLARLKLLGNEKTRAHNNEMVRRKSSTK